MKHSFSLYLSGIITCLLVAAGSVSADTPVQPDELLKGFVHPPVNFNPGKESDSEARKYQGIPTIERALGGRLWAAWYAGPIREEKFNYMVAATSADDGETWSDLKLVIDPDGTGPLRASDPCFWLDPNGKLWLFWWMNGDGLHVTMSISTENPDAENPVWTEPKALFPGVMLNKPIVVKNGEWLMPAAIWHRDDSCRMMVSKDSGKTWALRGTANVPEARRQCDEPMVVERKDGSLWQLVRTATYGIGETVSTDGGQTWAEVTDYLHGVTSRFYLRRLHSGNLLLIKHHGVDVPGKTGHRNHLMAFLSEDDGKTWKGGLLMDERFTVSYPDATQAPDGTIYAIYDWNRADEKNILMTTFTEEDVLAGAYISDKARSRVLINHAIGINPKPWLKKADSAAGLRADTSAASLKPGQGATLVAEEGRFQPLEVGAKLFSNRAYTLHSLPEALSGKQFFFSTMEKTAATCLKPGRVYVLTPTKDRNPDSVEGELLAAGFEKTSAKEFFLFAMKGQTRFPNACSIYQKQVQVGEKIVFGKWGVLVGTGGTAKPAFMNPPQVMSNPSPAHAPSSRRFQGIPSMAVAPGSGRLWATWYAGKTPKEDQNNYVVVSTSGDGGKTWTERRIIDPDGVGPARAFDPELWVAPDGVLWAFWAQAIGHDGTVAGVWAMKTDRPDAENPAWGNPVRLTDGVMMCKPIVLSSGEWVLPVSTWRGTDNSARMVVSIDQGRTWSLRGACNVPKEVRNYDEHMIVERKDGSLWMLVRTNYGIGESVSQDRGVTWSPLLPSKIKHAVSRFFIHRLASGNLLLVKHGGIHEKTGRSHLTAFLSMDDGKTWEGGLLLDERNGVSYPDGMQAADGSIYIAYDRDRRGTMEILMAKFSEEDVLAGAYVGNKARSKVLISPAIARSPADGADDS